MAVNILFDEVDFLPKKDDDFDELSKDDINLLNYINATTGSKLDSKQTKCILKELKISLLGAIVFIILSIPHISNLLNKIVENKYYQLIIKVLLFIIIFYILQNRFT